MKNKQKWTPASSVPPRSGETISGPAYAEALLFARSALANKMVAFHQRYDLLLTPTLAVEAFEAGRNTPANGSFGEDWTAWTPFTYPFNITQQPAATVPCGLTTRRAAGRAADRRSLWRGRAGAAGGAGV